MGIVKPGKIVCVGRNYLEHARELGNEVPAEPLIFFKPATSIIRSGDPILLPAASRQVEFEGEIGVVIARPLRNVTREAARVAIGGVVPANDVTARDLQRRDGQWARAKGFDTFCPVGDIIPAPAALDELTVITRVNGEERQRGRSAEMAFDIPHLLAYISGIMTLEPGDLVLTGTPAGVGPLLAGDEVEVELEGLGRVINPVAAAPEGSISAGERGDTAGV